MRITYRLTATVLISVVSAVLTLSAPRPAAAGPTCYQSSCNGQDPSRYSCSADTISSFYYNGSSPDLRGALIELRRSRSCDAAWARVTNGSCRPMWIPCGFVLEVSRGTTQYGANPTPGAQVWTTMWSFRNYVRACFVVDFVGDSYRRDGCTGWH
ncbi:DUF2690 domain-containing protein [Krasilnikovia sp. M28-CT-15]|uniref:DUF2690 domain-containing protein n=1 Tax=Krasilnikovia sp. M28-CT-15 TaxID=3373540 RepID=UPI003876219B